MVRFEPRGDNNPERHEESSRRRRCHVGLLTSYFLDRLTVATSPCSTWEVRPCIVHARDPSGWERAVRTFSRGQMEMPAALYIT